MQTLHGAPSRQEEHRVAELTQLRDWLSSCCGCLSLDRCALSNPGDLAEPGSRRPMAGPGAAQAMITR